MKKNILTDIFNITYTQFIELNSNQRQEIFDKVAKASSAFCKKYFEKNKNVDWIIIAEKEENIISKGFRGNEPFSEEIEAISKEKNKVVFTFSRPAIIEEIHLSG